MNHKLKNERFRRRLVSILSCIVVFCTTYALILPAVTLERDDIVYYCGKEEHQHTDECYESPKDKPLCGLKEGEMVDGHVHDESCYKTEMVLDCLEDHEHTDECYKEEKMLVCDKEEGAQEHKHSSKCFLSTEPLCGKEVHTHSRECESNKDLKETKEDWEHSIPAKLKDTAAERMVQIALSQKDYKEVKENFELDEEGHEHYYTRYGEWYGRPYEDWNVMFVSFVLRYAGIKNEQIPYGHDWNEWIEDLTKKQLFADEGYVPKDGDLIFIKDKEDENVPDKEIRNYVGIVTDIENRKIVVGDLNGQVKEITLDDKEYETNAYVAMIESDVKDDVPVDKEESNDNETNEEERPDEEAGKEEAKEEETDPIEFRMPEQFEIENEDFTLTLTPRVFDEEEENEEQTEENSEETNEEGLKIKKFSLNEENIQDKIDAENELTKEELEQIAQANEEQKKEEEDKPLLTVQLEKIDEQAQTSEEEQAEIEQLKQQSLENVDQDNLLDLSFYKLRFFANDQEVDLKDQKFDAELTPTEQFVEKYDTTKDLEDVKPEAEVGLEVSIFLNSPSKNEDVTKLLEKKNDTTELYQAKANSISSIPFFVNGRIFANRAISVDGPQFYVQTFGYIKQNIKNTPDAQVPIIEQTNMIGDFASHSFETATIDTYKIDGSGRFVKEDHLLELYREQSYHYASHPNLTYFDRLVHNVNYDLDKIWVLKKGHNKTSIAENDWDVYSKNIHFTNRKETQESDPNNFILIEEGTVIRLIYKQSTNTTHTEPANLYDYDIFYKDNTNKYWTQKQKKDGTYEGYGINSVISQAGNNETVLFSGNRNSGITSHCEDIILSGSKSRVINAGIGEVTNNGIKYKSPPVFGIATGLNNGIIQYNSQIKKTPLYFNEGSIPGKREIGNTKLSFNRTGDSYVFTSITGDNVSLSNLDQLNNPLAAANNKDLLKRYTNDFWPLDNNLGTDGKTGTKDNKSTFQQYYSEPSAKKGKYMPTSDNGIPHNNLFGMRFEVKFNLDEDYLGPLEYFFYGDDDLWVFLDNTLVCDLGGVHLSYGAHVNLDSVLRTKDANGNISNKSGEHTLTVFYMERGFSGSTCYMEYILPSVKNAETNQTTGGLKIKKETTDDDISADFQFRLNLKKDGQSLRDDYPYVIYDKDGNKLGDYLYIWNEGTITLKKGQEAYIEKLPQGTEFYIEEINVPNSTLVYTSTDGTNWIKNKNINGNIVAGNTPIRVYFKNDRSYQLPETGSLGIDPPLIAGSAGVMTTSFYALTLKRKGRWKKRKR